MVESKTIRVKRDTWRDLHEEKDPGDTFDDVIQDLMSEAEERMVQ